jgi:hypothetical protein
MVNEGTTGGEAVYVCPEEGCGRRLVINRLRPALIVIDRGDFFARHVSEGLRVGIAIR